MSLLFPERSSVSTQQLNQWQQAALDWLMNFNSASTRKSYRNAVNSFFASCTKPPEQVAQGDVLRFRYEMEDAGYNQTTINQRLAGLSSFYLFAVGRGLRADNPCDGVKRKAVNPYGKATFLDGTSGQDLQLLRVINRKTDKGKRDYAILLTLLTTAVRVEAVANLRIRDLRGQGEMVFMQYTNKGGETVEKRLQPVVIRAMVDYLDTRRELTEDSPVFVMTPPGRRGTENLNTYTDNIVDTDKPLTSRTIQKLVKYYADKAFGPGHGITPHSLRHTAAMNAIQSGASVIEVSRLLRHKNLRVTTIYIQHVSDKADDSVSEKLGKRYE
ncbi:MAG: tyrosine-type recombinase/integrase [Anaerolineae bacterium]|nr:tyrosine-type recombinase/integrase [Anaerolineae bacterium]